METTPQKSPGPPRMLVSSPFLPVPGVEAGSGNPPHGPSERKPLDPL